MDRGLKMPAMRQATRHGNTVLCSGHYAVDAPARPITEQTISTLRFLESTLVSMGTGKNHLLQAVAYLSDIQNDYEDFVRIWNDWIAYAHSPALSCV